MPLKGRSQPCDDPMKKGHTKRSQYNDVRVVGKSVIQQYRQKLPEHKWKTGTRLCLNCRTAAAKKAGSREGHLEGVLRLAAHNTEPVASNSTILGILFI